jgi:hypothetical protein
MPQTPARYVAEKTTACVVVNFLSTPRLAGFSGISTRPSRYGEKRPQLWTLS